MGVGSCVKTDFLPETVEFYTDKDLPDLEIRSSFYRRCSFAKHTHNTLSVGVVLRGEGKYIQRGTGHAISQGNIVLVPPGEVHACNPRHDVPWAYLMFHLTEQCLQKFVSCLPSARSGEIYFPAQVVRDPVFHGLLVSLYLLVKNRAGRLEKEAVLYAAICALLTRHAGMAAAKFPGRGEPRLVALVKDYLTDNLHKNISIHELSSVTGISAYHVLHVFREAMGMPPHAYQIQLRVQEARKLLLNGHSIVEAALEAGFCDQSHFSKKFKQIVGVTPRRYVLAHDAGRPVTESGLFH